MKILWNLLAIALLALSVQSCNKENKVAKEFDGTWMLDYQWSGGPSADAAVVDSAGTWNFTSCKTSKETCFAVYDGEDDDQMTFSWGIDDGAESMSITVPIEDHWMYQFQGTYDIFSKTEQKIVLLSNDCTNCGADERGTYTLELTK